MRIHSPTVEKPAAPSKLPSHNLEACKIAEHFIEIPFSRADCLKIDLELVCVRFERSKTGFRENQFAKRVSIG